MRKPKDAAAVERAVGDVAQAPASPCLRLPPCDQPFRVTRSRIITDGVERFWEECGAIAGTVTIPQGGR